jgi:probable O-glycosylation ligase (exosortase A-associated)
MTFINWWILITGYVAFYSILHSGKGSGGWFNDENDLSLFLNTMLPFAYYLIFFQKKTILKLLYISALVLCLIAEILSFSRGGFVGLFAVGFSIWFFGKNRLRNGIILFLIVALMGIFAGSEYWSEMSTITETESGTAQSRIQMWKSAWLMFLDNPLGVGGNNFQVRFDEYQTDHFRRGMWGRPAHSLWFTLIPELGIFGSLIYLLLLRANIKDIWFLKRLKTDNDDFRFLHTLSLAIIASLAGYFASGTFLSVLYYPYYWYLTGLIVASVLIAKRLEKSREIR